MQPSSETKTIVGNIIQNVQTKPEVSPVQNIIAQLSTMKQSLVQQPKVPEEILNLFAEAKLLKVIMKEASD